VGKAERKVVNTLVIAAQFGGRWGWGGGPPGIEPLGRGIESFLVFETANYLKRDFWGGPKHGRKFDGGDIY